MDPVSQGVLGAVAANSLSHSHKLSKAAIIGALAGMAPDLDALIRSSTDPLLAIEYHRQFTHSLLFIPLGGLICSLVLHPLLGRHWQLNFAQTLLWCLIGYATHGVLDAFTSYGTQLAWPISDQRFAWNIISVIDPLFTLPLLISVCCAIIYQRKLYVYAGLVWIVIYLGAGYIQHKRAEMLGWQLANERNHQVLRLEVKPSFANLAVWKVFYETPERFFVDAIKPGITRSIVWEGEKVTKLDLQSDLGWLDQTSQQARDLKRFAQFSAGYLALDPRNRNRIGDIRYSLLPNQIAPVWGIQLSRDSAPGEHVQYYVARKESRAALSRLVDMIME